MAIPQDFWEKISIDVRLLGDRGISGIDGMVSVTLGAAAVSEGPVVGVVGDVQHTSLSRPPIGPRVQMIQLFSTIGDVADGFLQRCIDVTFDVHGDRLLLAVSI